MGRKFVVLQPPAGQVCFSALFRFCRYGKIDYMVTIRQIEREVTGFKKEVADMKVAVLSMLKDPEGEYLPEFVKRALGALKKHPSHEYKKGSFLKLLR